MKIAMIQKNYIVGDFVGNSDKIIEASKKYNQKADLIVFSELCLCGYYPWDLMLRDRFFTEQFDALDKIMDETKNINSYIVIGLITKNNSGVGKDFHNSLAVLQNGKMVFQYHKKLLPTYNIFDEARHFEPGDLSGVANLNINNKNTKIGFFVCEDGWNDETYDYMTNPIKEIGNSGAKVMIGINASPSNIHKSEQRDKIFGKIATRYGLDLIYVNQVGANDDIVFDGASFAFDEKGNKSAQLSWFEEDEYVYDTEQKTVSNIPTPEKYELIFNQIGLGLKDYMHKQGLKTVITGASGGVDSSLSLTLAKIFLGAENVKAITMPSKHSSEGSVDHSVALCKNLGIELLTFPILNEISVVSNDFTQNLGFNLTGLAAENLQARMRGAILMAYSNQKGNILITNGNKSEIAVGYFTLYGDSNGGLNLIGDLYKTEVYGLCEYINKRFGNIIPEIILTKEPSAELSPDQKDSDSLPIYEKLDAILKKELEWDYLNTEEQLEVTQILTTVTNQEIRKVLTLIDRAEFKRKQAAPIIRIHPRAFGSGRRVPIVHKLPV